MSVVIGVLLMLLLGLLLFVVDVSRVGFVVIACLIGLIIVNVVIVVDALYWWCLCEYCCSCCYCCRFCC